MTTTRDAPVRSRSGARGATATTGAGAGADETAMGAKAGMGADDVEVETGSAVTSVAANWWMARLPTTTSALAASTAASPLTIHPDFVGGKGPRSAWWRSVGSS